MIHQHTELHIYIVKFISERITETEIHVMITTYLKREINTANTDIFVCMTITNIVLTFSRIVHTEIPIS